MRVLSIVPIIVFHLSIIFCFVASVPEKNSNLTTMIQSLKGNCSARSCPKSFDYIPCYCDPMCFWHRDCCEDYSLHTLSSVDFTVLPDNSHLECLQPCITLVPGCRSETYHMITKCCHDWKMSVDTEQNIVAQLCEDIPLVGSPPVTDNLTGIVYRNKYCAVCNNVPTAQLLAWPSKWSCDERFYTFIQHSIPVNSSVFKDYCIALSYEPPQLSSGIRLSRQCYSSLVTTCSQGPPANMSASLNYANLVANCSNFGVGIVVRSNRQIFSNPYCAMCNTASVGVCQVIKKQRGLDGGAFRLTLTFFFDSLSKNTISYEGNTIAVTSTLTCHNQTVYDPFSESCRKPAHFNNTSFSNSTYCAFVTLRKTEYILSDSITVQWLGDNLFYPIVGTSDENEPIICVNLTQDYNKTTVTTSEDELEGPHSVALEALSYFGLALDIISGGFILFTYCSYRELKTLYGKLLLNMVTIVIISDLVLVVGHPISAAIGSQSLCTALAIIIHYVFLVRFFSCSTLFSEAMRTFYSALKVIPTPDNTFKRIRNCQYLFIYLLLAYTLSAAITVICIIFNFTLQGSIGYGFQVSACWMSNDIAISVAFVAPLCLSLIYNIVAFVFCTYIVVKLTWFTKAKREAKTQKNVLIQNFRVILALISVSGVSWIFFAFILIPGAGGKDHVWGRYIFVILNGSQLSIVALAYICSKNMIKRYWQSAKSRFSQFTHNPLFT